MARMGFLDKVMEIDGLIEAERARLKKERDEQETKILNQKMGGLQMAHRRRLMNLDREQMGQIRALKEKGASDVEELKTKQKKEYDHLISETATRATGGVSSCVCANKHLCRHNKSASYNTRKPSKDVIRLRQNAQRLRTSGRIQEAEEVENMGAYIEARAESQWRKNVEESILSSAWSGGKSRLEQMVERQQKALRSLSVTQSERMALLKEQHDLQRRNLASTLAAERKKVIVYCRREALKRMTQDVAAKARDERRMGKHKSNGMQNVSKNMFKDSDDSSADIDEDDERLEGWVAPTACGVDNSKALSSYEDIKSGNIYKKLEDGTFGAEEGGDGKLQTSGSRAMDAYRMRTSGATATFDPTRGGAQVHRGRLIEAGTRIRVGVRPGPNKGKGKGEARKKGRGSDSSEEDDSDDDGYEDDDGSEGEDDSDDSDENGGPPGPPKGAPPRGPPKGSSPRGPPRGPVVTGPPRGPPGSGFPAGGFGPPGIAQGVPMVGGGGPPSLAGVPGGMAGGAPRPFPGGPPGGMLGGTPGPTSPGGLPAGMAGGPPRPFPGGPPGGMPRGAPGPGSPGGMPSGPPSPFPGGLSGSMPGGTPGPGFPGGMTGGAPGPGSPVGIPGGPPRPLKGGPPGGMVGGAPGPGSLGGSPGGMASSAPRPFPGGPPGGIPGGAPGPASLGGVPGGMAGGTPRTVPGGPPGGIPGG
ncbi:unnamed protein product, partial [Discosporangium mesarthrocarpum]